MGLIHVSNWHGDTHGRSLGMLAPVVPADPLGAGNTALQTALGVTPLGWWDVRQNLTTASGAASSLADVKGDGTYGPALVQATGANQPTWDGTTLNFSGAVTPNNQFLVSASAATGLDLSTQLTVALIVDGQTATTTAVLANIGAAAGGSPWWRVSELGTGGAFITNTSTHGAALSSAAVSGTGNIHLIIATVNVAGTDAVTLEVPATAKVSNAAATALASGNQLVALGAGTNGAGPSPMRFRALIIWAGGYTTGQKSTLVTYAQTYHLMVTA